MMIKRPLRVKRTALPALVSARDSAIFPLAQSPVPETHRAMTFESNLARLEQVVSQLETDRLDLDASLRLFEEGIELLRLASGELNEAETRVKELVERADGVLELRDFGG